MQTIVLAAGAGSRMGPLSSNRPKSMQPVGNKPLLGHILDAATGAGADELVIVTGDNGDEIREYVDYEYADHPVTYTRQETSDGTASAVLTAGSMIDEQFAVLNGDCLYREADLAKLYKNGPAIGVYEVDDPGEYGVVSLENGRVRRIIEKPSNPPTPLANAGAYVFPESILEYLDVEKSVRGEYELTRAVDEFLEAQHLRAIEFDEWMDVGRPWQLLEANEIVLRRQDRYLEGSVDPNATITGNVIVEDGARVKAGVHIDGPARIRSGATIGPNALIRGASMVGPHTKIGHAVEIKNSVVMEGAAISHLSYVGDSVVGQNVSMGAGTAIANLRHDRAPVEVTIDNDRVSTGREKFGAVVGDGVKTGINTSINPGVILSTRTMTMPGETVFRDR